MRIACIIVATERREQLLTEAVIPSVLAQRFAEVVVVGDYHDGPGYRYLPVPPMMRNTLDALVKRDVGTVATTSPWLVYLCDDHAVVGDFRLSVNAWAESDETDVLVPSRFADHPQHGRIRINNGEREMYCGGHGGVFKREVIASRPWSAMPHHRLWDYQSSEIQLADGWRFATMASQCVGILDLMPEARPWQ